MDDMQATRKHLMILLLLLSFLAVSLTILNNNTNSKSIDNNENSNGKVLGQTIDQSLAIRNYIDDIINNRDGSYTIIYRYVYENLSDYKISNFQSYTDLVQGFYPLEYKVTEMSGTNLTTNSNFNGDTEKYLFTSQELLAKEKKELTFKVTFRPGTSQGPFKVYVDGRGDMIGLNGENLGTTAGSTNTNNTIPKPLKEHLICEGEGVYIYSENNFEGECARYITDISNFKDTVFGNDRAKSIKVVGEYAVALYKHAGYKSPSTIVETDEISDLGITVIGSRALSSLKIFKGSFPEGFTLPPVETSISNPRPSTGNGSNKPNTSTTFAIENSASIEFSLNLALGQSSGETFYTSSANNSGGGATLSDTSFTLNPFTLIGITSLTIVIFLYRRRWLDI